MAGALSHRIACLTIAWLAYAPSSVIDTDRPVHLLVLALISSFAILTLINEYAPIKRKHTIAESRLLEELCIDRYGLEEKQVHEQGLSPGMRTNPFPILLATAVLTIRIEVQRRIFLESECTTRSVAVFMPLLLSIYDAGYVQRPGEVLIEENVDSTAYEDLLQNIKSNWLSNRWRYVPTAFLLSFGCYLVGGLWLSSQSNVVCPLWVGARQLLPKLQILALFLDAFLIIVVSRFASSSSLKYGRENHGARAWLAVPILSSMIWIGIGVAIYQLQPENRAWLLLENEAIPIRSFIRLFARSVLLAVVGVASLLSLRSVGSLHATMALTALASIVPGFRFIWSSNKPYPPMSSANLTWSFVFIYAAWSLHSHIRRSIDTQKATSSKSRRITIFFVFTILILPGLNKTNSVQFHPIDFLMYNAQKEYTDYLNTAARSRSLKDVVENYQARYHENPPPGFDVWFEYARNHSVWVTDEFDQIYNDLLPFRTMLPADLRRQTWEDISDPWNEIAGVTIRDGKVKIQEDDLLTHRWMAKGVVQMISSFSQFLPDMDLALNVNDECRIALKHDHIQSLKYMASQHIFNGSQTWSQNRAVGWENPPIEPTSDTVYEDWSNRNTYIEWGTAGCPSTTRRSVKPLYKSQICTQCASEHSLGQFVANWSLAGDPCHQPDLAYMHGHFNSPAAFKPTHHLRPVFSQSKLHGYNDILYPSAWNYIEKVKYEPVNATSAEEADETKVVFPDPPFTEKQSTLYWRGATSEGISDGHLAWRGMTRQRMVHMAENSSDSDHDQVILLLPDQQHPERFTYTSMAGKRLPHLGLHSSVLFVDDIARCGGRDCLEQEKEFASAPKADFQVHWQYKYLMDMDGAGYSGRFLPFLQSRSLPFKSALFREWYDSRLIPWLHFVPLDLRLHGLWSSLAYFEGVSGSDERGRKWNWQGHEREAIVIAEGGRDWAAKALTKADMEVYMFRLLLEWGRLTDDNRDRLGYKYGG